MSRHVRATIAFPRRRRGRQSVAAQARFDREVRDFCVRIRQINSTLDFEVSSRGWCYILEEYGLRKGDFDDAQELINDCRRSGRLPLDICMVDGARAFENLEDIDDTTPDEEADDIVSRVRWAHEFYTPISFWDDQPVYIQMLVEKKDLKSLFGLVADEFHIPIANAGGWSDINGRAAMMRRFKEWEAKGKKCVLLYCGDHDPGGLQISSFLRSNMEDLAGAVGWRPDDLIIDRFGLNHDFIKEHRLTWIENLETSSGKSLDDQKHKDHKKPYVRDYLKAFGARKVEANALVVRPDAGRDLCRRAILKYLDEGAPERYEIALQPHREAVHEEVLRLLAGAA